MSKILTAEEYIFNETGVFPISWQCNIADSDSCSDLMDDSADGYDIDIMRIMDAYAKYYAQSLIEGLTNEMIKNQFYHTFERIGAEWARQELLNRLNQEG